MHPPMVSQKFTSFVSIITLRDFFVEFFSEEEYDTYLSNVQTAVLEAYKYVGLQSVSNLTPQHLPFFIKGILEDLSFSTLSSKSYSIIHEDNLKPKLKKEFKNNLNDPNTPFTDKDYKELDRLFYGEKRYLALCGKEAFAHSFITSEYLYQTLRSNNEFDYTAIVSGYLKSVEQLLPVHEKQLLTYLKLADKQLGLLVNFNESYLKRGIKRIVNGYKEEN